MANKGYYESEGSEYLNSDPSVSKEQSNVPEHNHDDRYYSQAKQDERDQAVDERFIGVDENFMSLYQTIDQMSADISEKANIDHTHALATQTEPGFMSAADKTKLDNQSTTVPAHTHPNATEYDPGFMSSSHYTKLSGLASEDMRMHISAKKSAASQQAVPASTMTKVIWDGVMTAHNVLHERKFVNSEFDGYDGVFTINVSVGFPRLSANAAIELYLFINNVQKDRLAKVTSPAIASGQVSSSISLSLKSGDKVDFRVFATEAINIYSSGSFLAVTEIS